MRVARNEPRPYDAGMTSAFAIVTPVLDGWPRIQATVASVDAARRAGTRVRHVVQLHSRTCDPSRDWLARQPQLELRIAADQGLYDAIARGLAGATEPYLGWLNADEQHLPGALARAAGLLDADPAAGVVFGDYLLLDARGDPVALRRELPARRWYLRHGVNSVLSCATFFRREVWERLGGFDLRYGRLADKEFYLRALEAGIRFRHAPECWGAFALTGRNRSTDAQALREQAELRRRTGAYPWRSARWLPRLFRRLEKLARGAYGRHAIRLDLFANDGSPRHVETVVGSRWRWP